MKQIYDVITLLISNLDQVLNNKKLVKLNYEKVAHVECVIHGLAYDRNLLFEDMKSLIDRLKYIENDKQLLQRANDFQGLYLRRSVNRDKAQWAIAGYQLDLLIDYIFTDDTKLLLFREIDDYIETLKFEHLRGPQRGQLISETRELLQKNYGSIAGVSADLFKKRIDRIVWELVTLIDFHMLKEVLHEIVYPRG